MAGAGRLSDRRHGSVQGFADHDKDNPMPEHKLWLLRIVTGMVLGGLVVWALAS